MYAAIAHVLNKTYLIIVLIAKVSVRSVIVEWKPYSVQYMSP